MSLIGETWISEAQQAGFYQMKGVISNLLEIIGVDGVRYLPEASMPFHPGRSAKILVDHSVMGEIGEIHPYAKNV